MAELNVCIQLSTVVEIRRSQKECRYPPICLTSNMHQLVWRIESSKNAWITYFWRSPVPTHSTTIDFKAPSILRLIIAKLYPNMIFYVFYILTICCCCTCLLWRCLVLSVFFCWGCLRHFTREDERKRPSSPWIDWWKVEINPYAKKDCSLKNRSSVFKSTLFRGFGKILQ